MTSTSWFPAAFTRLLLMVAIFLLLMILKYVVFYGRSDQRSGGGAGIDGIGIVMGFYTLALTGFLNFASCSRACLILPWLSQEHCPSSLYMLILILGVIFVAITVFLDRLALDLIPAADSERYSWSRGFQYGVCVSAALVPPLLYSTIFIWTFTG
jgi:hypothetical protein